jgi:WD40 repeat protein
LGSLDGTRIWGKSIKGSITHLAWSPDSNYILFATAKGKLEIYDTNGSFFVCLFYVVYCRKLC